MNYLALNVPNYGRINAPNGLPEGNFDTFIGIIRNGIIILLVVAIILTLIFLIWGGINWTTSGGNKEGLQKAKQKLTFAIIGFIVVLLAFFIINFAGGLFGIKL